MKTEQLQIRKERGYQIAKTSRIKKTDKGWQVPSQSGEGYYLVVSNGFGAKCSCPDHEFKQNKCKHIFAVELIITQEVDKEGNVRITKTVRKTYPQNWSKYNQSQQVEKEMFMKLLANLTSAVPQPAYSFGRPTLPLADMLYTMVFKVYSTFSGRRFTSDMGIALEKGYLSKKPHYNSVFNYFQKADLTPLLVEMVTVTSLPLRSIEADFAVDSTGFGTSNFQRWYSFKHGKEIDSQRWVKCHFMTGVKSNIVTSVKITSEFGSDTTEMPELLKKTAEHFDMNEISADKAYSSRKNLALIEDAGAMPFIPFKQHTTDMPKGVAIWKKMWHYFQYNRDDFLQHYHKRSNVESTIHMIKSKFGDSVRSKTWNAEVNEVLCKIICHNIVVVINEIHSLGIKADFTS